MPSICTDIRTYTGTAGDAQPWSGGALRHADATKNTTLIQAIAATVIGLASVSAYAAGLVFDGEQYPGPQSLTSNVSYSQVRAELDQFKAQGLAFNDATYPVPGRTVPNKQAQRELASFGTAGQATLIR